MNLFGGVYAKYPPSVAVQNDLLWCVLTACAVLSGVVWACP